MHRALFIGAEVADRAVLTTDMPGPNTFIGPRAPLWIQRPPKLAWSTTPMVNVVRHALASVPGPPEEIIVLLQPTQPLRTTAHVRAAIDLLEQSGADSVVSVVELPATHSPDMVLAMDGKRLQPWLVVYGLYQEDVACEPWSLRPTRRQDAAPAYRPDGTVYAFRRNTLDKHETLYGRDVRPLVIPSAETCELDTEADWDALVARVTSMACTCSAPQPHAKPSGTVVCQNLSCGALIVPTSDPLPRP